MGIGGLEGKGETVGREKLKQSSKDSAILAKRELVGQHFTSPCHKTSHKVYAPKLPHHRNNQITYPKGPTIKLVPPPHPHPLPSSPPPRPRKGTNYQTNRDFHPTPSTPSSPITIITTTDPALPSILWPSFNVSGRALVCAIYRQRRVTGYHPYCHRFLRRPS